MSEELVENEQFSVTNEDIESILALCDTLKEKTVLKDTFRAIKKYLKTNFEVTNLDFVLNDKRKTDGEIIFSSSSSGEDKDYPLSFLIQINHYISLTYKFHATNKEHYKELKKKEKVLEAFFKVLSQSVSFIYSNTLVDELIVTDSVTNIHNRNYLDEYLSQMIPLARRENKILAFLTIGVNNFKAVIDEYNYLIGDKILVELAKVLKQSIRSSDIAVKLDGDEFLVVLHNVINEENAMMVAYKIINSFKEKEVRVDVETKETLMKTLCVGISVFKNDSEEIEELQRFSSIALVEAKNQGINSAMLYSRIQDQDFKIF